MKLNIFNKKILIVFPYTRVKLKSGYHYFNYIFNYGNLVCDSFNGIKLGGMSDIKAIIKKQ